mmetsp:Transcript_121832/g.192972  ORF Transcript_121832/g.192972 Transcript_121832/m.192972 type:complete len:482 (+) Transcript_121832:59-1504(+)
MPGIKRSAACLTVEKLPASLREAEYAVRGAIVTRAGEIDAQLKAGTGNFPFEETVPCNIGNPQAVGAKPLTFHRQVLSILTNPSLMNDSSFPEDVKARAGTYLASFGKFGAYSHSKGVDHFRQEIARFITRRDGANLPASNPEHIFLTNGASDAVKSVLHMLIRGPDDAILVPVPQYPLYSAAIRMLDGHFLGYYLEEDSGWSASASVIKDTIENYRKQYPNGCVRGLVVINPGNPTGQIMDEKDMANVVDLCEKEGIVLLADEVYQENHYTKPWTSFRKVILEKNSSLEAFSFHSASKGFYGECGIRAGYTEALNIDADVLEQLYKMASMSLCSNTLGQAIMASIVNPPVEGDASFALYQEERDGVLSSLKRKAKLVTERLNKFPGVSCQVVEGAMYAFPQVKIPSKAVEAAKAKGQAPDFLYCWELLENTGVVVVPGSGFAQKEGTFHYRTTILPDEAKLPAVLDRMETFHKDFVARYS